MSVLQQGEENYCANCQHEQKKFFHYRDEEDTCNIRHIEIRLVEKNGVLKMCFPNCGEDCEDKGKYVEMEYYVKKNTSFGFMIEQDWDYYGDYEEFITVKPKYEWDDLEKIGHVSIPKQCKENHFVCSYQRKIGGMGNTSFEAHFDVFYRDGKWVLKQFSELGEEDMLVYNRIGAYTWHDAMKHLQNRYQEISVKQILEILQQA